MKPIYHIALSSLIAGGSFAATRSTPIAASTFAVGFLIDADHLFDYSIYCFQKRKWPKLREFFGSSCSPPPSRMYLPLHAYEFLLLIWLTSFCFSAWAWAIWLSLSFAGHLLMDQLAYPRHPLWYLFTFRMIRGFSYNTVERYNQKMSGRGNRR